MTVEPVTVEPATTVRLNGTASADPDGAIVEWAFDLDGDGTFDRVTERAAVRVTYADPGEYPVRLRVTDDDGATATATGAVTVTGTTSPTPAPATETVVRTVQLPGSHGGLARRLGLPAGLIDSLRGVPPTAAAIGALLVGALVGVSAWRRRGALRQRVRSVARRLKRQLTPRKIASRVGKKLIKKGLRKAGEAIETGGDATGRGIRRLGDAVEGVTKRVGRTLKRWGG